IPMAKTVAEINMDMFIPYGRTHDMSIVGFGESQMDDYLKEILAPASRTIAADGESAKGYFFRSDQINFARKGVPVLYVHSGLDKLDGGKTAGLAASEDYTKNRYHKPADRFDPHWDLSGVIEDVQALYAVGKRLADEFTFPQWVGTASSSRRVIRRQRRRRSKPRGARLRECARAQQQCEHLVGVDRL